MSDAKARAEARRKAILARGGDRLARITTSARGEEGASYMHDGMSTSAPLFIPHLPQHVFKLLNHPTVD